MNRLLIINPGSTSTKIAVYDDDTRVFQQSISHDTEELIGYEHIIEQTEFRKAKVLSLLEKAGYSISEFNAIVARGGILPPLATGGYLVNEDMLYQLKYEPVLEHASNLGAVIADELGRPYGIPSYIYDAVSADEMDPLFKITGLPEIQRKGQGHNLNLRASAMRYAEENNKKLSDCNLIVAHLGGGTSIGLFQQGRMIDIVNDEDGPMTPERAGALPMLQLIDLFIGETVDRKQLKRRIKTQAGLTAYFGTNDAREVEALVRSGDEHAKMIFDAMILGISKCIGKEAAGASGNIESIILTGGMAHSKLLCDGITTHVSFIAPVIIYPGEDEMRSLALGGLRIINGKEECHTFVRN